MHIHISITVDDGRDYLVVMNFSQRIYIGNYFPIKKDFVCISVFTPLQLLYSSASQFEVNLIVHICAFLPINLNTAFASLSVIKLLNIS